jgi:hypothetical protein
MARPLEFEYVIECEDPAAEVARLLSMRPNEAALRTLREVDKLDWSRLKLAEPRKRSSTTE